MDTRLQFDTSYLIGIEQVDREHAKLFEIAAAIAASLPDGGESAVAAARMAVADLIDYTRRHFTNEEALMAAAGYPALAAHRKLHRDLATRVRNMEMWVEFEERHAPIELSRFLYDWLVNHIRVEDMKFGEFVRVSAPTPDVVGELPPQPA
jgi:hemerythrin-like metal-binding protein